MNAADVLVPTTDPLAPTTLTTDTPPPDTSTDQLAEADNPLSPSESMPEPQPDPEPAPGEPEPATPYISLNSNHIII